MSWRFHRTAQEFLSVATDHLAAEPVRSTLIASVAAQLADGSGTLTLADGLESWFATLHDDSPDGADAEAPVLATAMRTAPFPPHPVALDAMPDAAAADLARLVLATDGVVHGANGALPAVEVFSRVMATSAGARVERKRGLRLYELGDLHRPSRLPPGRLRRARLDELDLAVEWYAAFEVDAEKQSGRTPEARGETPTRHAMTARIEAGRIWIWEVDGRPVHLTGQSVSGAGVTRIGPVYTPEADRGHGFGAAAVAEVSARIRAGGDRVCLFTDPDNPVSNALYLRLGFEPLEDMAAFRVV